MTNDFNLNKVAELQGIEVLNINQLATALKPAILPGEQMNIKILKEGKEYGQESAILMTEPWSLLMKPGSSWEDRSML